MPCRDPDPHDYTQRKEFKELTEKCNALTQMLCAVLQQMENLRYLHVLDRVTLGWWKSHKEADAERLRKKNLKEGILAKL